MPTNVEKSKRNRHTGHVNEFTRSIMHGGKTVTMKDGTLYRRSVHGTIVLVR